MGFPKFLKIEFLEQDSHNKISKTDKVHFRISFLEFSKQTFWKELFPKHMKYIPKTTF